MNKINWQSKTDDYIEVLGGRKARLLLHACCAPCSSASLEYLTQHFSVDLLFYNPNISTKEEYKKRLSELKRFVEEYPFSEVKIIAPNWNHSEFLDAVKGLESLPEGGDRCKKCFMLRLGKAAELCYKLGYEYFATTLTISPLKNAEIINRCGIDLENEQIAYLPTDLKKRGRYIRSIELSKEYCLYRQNFCGCEFSKKQP